MGLSQVMNARPGLCCLLAGGVTALALPPAGLWPLLFLTVPVFILCLGEASGGWRKAAWHGWLFGFGLFQASLYWISFSLFVDIDRWWWLLPFAFSALPAAFALWYAAIGLVFRLVNPKGISAVALMAALWGLAEFGRGHLFTGFPWNLIGHVWLGGGPQGGLAIAQAASLTGVYALGMLTILLAGIPALIRLSGRQTFRLAAIGGLLVLASALFYGEARIAGIDRARAEAADDPGAAVVAVIQPDIAQRDKWNPELRMRNFSILLEETALALVRADGPVMVVWPETAIAGFPATSPGLLSAIGQVLGEQDILLTGGLRRDEAGRLFNSAFLIDGRGRIIGHYDKHHLVPFGEYVPFADLIALPSIAAGSSRFSSGPGPQTLAPPAPDFPAIAPLICYEVIFPGRAADPAMPPGLLVNITNDAWFGRSAGPWQHLAMSRMRAIEEGVMLARAAGTGISAIIDPGGQILTLVDLQVRDHGLASLIQPEMVAGASQAVQLMVFLNLLILLLISGVYHPGLALFEKIK